MSDSNIFSRMGIRKRDYQDYGKYVKHQASKLPIVKDGFLRTYEPEYQRELRQRLRKFGIVRAGMTVLCLGARLGAEVRAFIDCGCFAIGLDVNPGEDNKHVVRGDFHDIQYAAHSVDVVFTNSLDHVFDLNKFIGETCRVLKPGGFLIMEIVRGTAEGWQPDLYDCLIWEKIDDILAPFIIAGFDLIGKHNIGMPWRGQHVILKRANK